MSFHTEPKMVAFHTMGCRLNFSESGQLIEGLKARGHRLVEFGEPADLVVVNTCTVTDSADHSARNIIRRAVQSSPEGKIVVVGCYAQMAPSEVAAIDGVDLILGTSQKMHLLDYLDQEEQTRVAIDHEQDFWGAATSFRSGTHTRAFLKIQDGCNYICSYCIIPQARGRSRCIPVAQAVKEAQVLVDQGHREIVLTGVNIGEYEREAEGHQLTDLLIALTTQVRGLERLRLSSVEPNTLSDEVLKILKDCGRYQPHFHLPLQSGSDTILKLMRRKYTSDQYAKVIERVLKYFPQASFGADLIVGHPGETQEHFKKSVAFIQSMPITHFHVFPFSRRKKTTAAVMIDQVDHATKKERVGQLLSLGEQKLAALAQKKVGRFASGILLEHPVNDDQRRWAGHTPDFLAVEVHFDQPAPEMRNQIVSAQIERQQAGKLFGHAILNSTLQ